MFCKEAERSKENARRDLGSGPGQRRQGLPGVEALGSKRNGQIQDFLGTIQ